MEAPRLARLSSSLLRASFPKLEINDYVRHVLLRFTTAEASSFQDRGLVGKTRVQGRFLSYPSRVIAGQGDQKSRRNSSYGFGGPFRKSMGVFPNGILASRKFCTTSPVAEGVAMKVKSLDHVVLTVKDIDATCQFYSAVLGMEVVKFYASEGVSRVALSFGEQKINLHQVGEEFEPKAHLATSGSADLCFITDTPLDEMQKHIEDNGVTILQGPVARSGAMGAIRSVYFRDPDLNLIEVSNYV